MATEAILRKTNREIIKAHMKGCIKYALENNDGDDEKIDEFLDILDKIAK